MSGENGTHKRKTGQSSFTLIETIIALGLIVIIILEVSAVQGRAIDFSAFERKVTQASWLAKAIMSNIEYKWNYFELKDIKADEKDQKIPEDLCSPNPAFNCDFKYRLSIDEWKLPLVDLVAASAGDSTVAGIVKEQMKQILGDEILKVAHVTVSWTEGSRKDFVELAYLLTAQKKLDDAIELLQPVGVATDTKTGTDTGTQNPQRGDGQNPPNPPGGD
jgi:hypothetical protein